MIEITAALTSARTLLGLAKDALDARDDARTRQALSDLQIKLFDVTSAALAMAEKAAAVQSALSMAQDEQRKLQAQALDREQYTLHELRAGAFAYASHAQDAGSQQSQHYLCQPCYDKSIKSILRYAPGGEYFYGKWTCPESAQHAVDNTAPG